jgi:hypothetical protein
MARKVSARGLALGFIATAPLVVGGVLYDDIYARRTAQDVKCDVTYLEVTASRGIPQFGPAKTRLVSNVELDCGGSTPLRLERRVSSMTADEWNSLDFHQSVRAGKYTSYIGSWLGLGPQYANFRAIAGQH